MEKRAEFQLNGLDYIFVFDPDCDDPEEGATLTYVGNENGRLAPSQYAEDEAWEVAAEKLGLWH